MGDSVTVGYVHENEVAHSWHKSYMNLILHDLTTSQHIAKGGYIAMRCGTDGLPASRNATVLQFLDTDVDWLFWIDTDMGFAPRIVDQLLDAADPVERPIMGALCFAQREMAPDSVGGYQCKAAPTIYDLARGVDKAGTAKFGLVARQMYDLDTVTKCDATGSAAVLIHRSVFERIREKYGPTWYNRAPDGDPDPNGVVVMMGEDLSFCMRAGTLEIPVHVHAGVKTTHLKNVWLCEDDYRDQSLLAQVKATQAQLVAEATSA